MPNQTTADASALVARVRQLETAGFEVRHVARLTWNGSQIVNAVLLIPTCR